MPIKNCFFIFVLIIFIQSTLLAQNKIPKAEKLQEDVGDIKFDPKIDKADFYLCHKDFIIQYYNFGTSYNGGGRGIKDFIYKRYHYDSAYKLATGFITIRFVINCKGQTDRFRLSEIDNHYHPTTFDNGLKRQLLKICKALNQWIPGKDSKGNIYDSYYYINFKLVKGQILNITP
ncbi:hypothetical protein ABIB62_003540 [Mucilaginibacter sp. UYP25]|uniref:hypothetical protein n=1 Tax=unclassified Mucilaginibacter TaxID=2617802 RepID=UPI0033929C0F